MMMPIEEEDRRRNRIGLGQVAELLDLVSRGLMPVNVLQGFVESKEEGHELRSPVQVLHAFASLAARDKVTARELEGFIASFRPSKDAG